MVPAWGDSGWGGVNRWLEGLSVVITTLGLFCILFSHSIDDNNLDGSAGEGGSDSDGTRWCVRGEGLCEQSYIIYGMRGIF